MIGKFAKALALLSFTLFVLPNLFSQAAPAAQAPPAPSPNGQQPAAQETATPASSDQESTTGEVSSSRRKKPKDYKNWQYNVGAGANVDSGTTKTFVRGGGIVGTAGVARNANKYLGLRVDFIFADLPLRQSSLSLAQAGSASSYLFAGTIDPIINVPVSKLWGGYILLGPGYYHRSGTLNSDTAVPGSSCNPFFEWWGACPNVSIPLSGSFVNSSQNQWGYNFGAGITHKMPSGVELYAEFRITHGSSDKITTDVRPITVGVRW